MRRIAWEVGIVGVLLLAAPGSALAANISVTTTNDSVGAGGGCSLREAISASNANNTGPGGDCTAGTDDDVITVPASNDPYPIELGPSNEGANAGGDFDIDSPGANQTVVIRGAGAGDTVIDGDGVDRVFDIHDSSKVTLEQLTITGGHPPDGGSGGPGAGGGNGQPGGGIQYSNSLLILDGVVLEGNSAGHGGNGGIGPAGSPSSTGGNGGFGGSGGGIDGCCILEIVDSALVGNSAGAGGNGGAGGTGANGGPGNPVGTGGGSSLGGNGGFGAGGGAVNVNGGTLTIERSLIVDNRAGDSGIGGAGGTGGTGGTGTIVGGAGGLSIGGNSNFGGFGAGLQLNSTATVITDSTLAGNIAGAGGTGGAGGTPGAGGTGTLAGPAGLSNGGNGGNGGSQGAISSFTGGSLAISGSTVSDNEGGPGGNGGNAGPTGSGTEGGDGGFGGSDAGIGTGPGLSGPIADTTISGNATGDGGSGGSGGGGIGSISEGGNGGGSGSAGGLATSGTALLTHTTVASNRLGAAGSAGAAGNGSASATPGAPGGVGIVGGLRSNLANSITLQNSIVASNDGDECGGVFDPASARVLSFPNDATCPGTLHDDPLLGPLQDNGGPTDTMRPAGAAAINAVEATGEGCASNDQRGVGRPKGGKCDLGAVEVSPPSATTGAASGISANAATLGGTVNPGELPATYRFEYGTTTAYGTQTAVNSAGSGGANVAASQAITGLAPDTTYHYRIRAANPDGTAIGADGTFRTPKGPVSVSGCTRVGIRTTSLRLDSKGRAAIRLRATGGPCRGTLSLTRSVKVKRKRKNVSVGKARYSLKVGQTKTVRIKVKRGARTVVKRKKKLATSAKVTFRDASGKAKSTKRKVTLKPAKRKRKR
jgi:CSLREA domain-containing protein